MSKKSITLLVSSIALLALTVMLVTPNPALSAGATTNPWPSFRHDLLNTAAAPDSGYPTSNTVLWSVNRSDRPDSPGNPAAAGGAPVIDKGMVFTTGTGIVQTNDQFNGNLIWSKAFPWEDTTDEPPPGDVPYDWCYNDIPTFAEGNTGVCYVANLADCPGWCFSCTDEDPDCSSISLVDPFPFGEGYGQFITGPTLDTANDKIIFATIDGRVICLNLNDGTTLWERTPHKDPGGPNYIPPPQCGGGGGGPPWYDYRFAWHLSPPSIDNGKVYIGTFMPSFYYIFRAYPYGTAKMGYEYNNYWVGRDGSFYCMNEGDGSILWRANLLATG